MMDNPNITQSRPFAVAEALLGKPIDARRIKAKSVIVTGDAEALSTRNGQWCLLDALSILARVACNVVVVLPHGTCRDLALSVRKFMQSTWTPGKLTLRFGKETILHATVDAVLHVGHRPQVSSQCTVINSNGWVCRVDSTGQSIPNGIDQPNPIGALMAASFGCAEVFKRIYEVPATVAPLIRSMEFSAYDHSTSPTDNGPPLPDEILIPNTLLVGAGAIGNGIALLLGQLPLRGRLHVVDYDIFGPENFGTCVLMKRRGWLGTRKAEKVARHLSANSGLEVTFDASPIETARTSGRLAGIDIELALNGLDKPAPRREVQKLWPTTVIDGGINEVGAAVTRYQAGVSGMPCLMCWFEEQQIDERDELSRATGLSKSSLTGNQDRLLTPEDIAQAAEEHQVQLKAFAAAKRTVCSIISDAALAAKLGVKAEKGFRASVPFVATCSAALVVAEMLKSLTYKDASVPQQFRFDSVFLGPASAARYRRAPTPKCQCVNQASLILKILARRHGAKPVLTQ